MLTHYIIVRRDLPLGTVCAMITHAAGESVAEWTIYTDEDHRMIGCIAVVLGVHSEKELNRVVRRLKRHDTSFVMITEPDPPYDGQLMAIGLWPVERENVEKILREFQTLKELI